MRIPLRKMQDNQSGTIRAVRADGELGRRIRDMGLVPGTKSEFRDGPRFTTRWPCA